MDETNESRQRDFPESMVTEALADHLGEPGKENPQRMAWLFALQARTPDGSRKLSDLCGFDWGTEKIGGGSEEAFKENDKGKLALEEFRRTFWTVTPDFRYWTLERDKQLIVEAKGTPKPVGRRDDIQARRYFMYLAQTGYRGAVVYFAPNPEVWLNWLVGIARETATGSRFGVVDLNVDVVPTVSNELVHVVGKALVQTAHLLEVAMGFPKVR